MAAIEIHIGDVTDMEARVYARYVAAQDEAVVLQGSLRGPYCENGRTLPAEFSFRDRSPEQPGLAEAIVTDPCLWSSEMPHVYRVEVEARQGAKIVAAYHGTVGLRRLAPRRPVDFAPGTG